MKKADIKAASVARKEFAGRLRSWRTSAGFKTMADFARELVIEQETYRRYERGETEPGVSGLTKIKAKLGVSLDYLVAGDLAALRRPDAGGEEAAPALPFPAKTEKPRRRRP